ncbi:hypothetical protein ABT167_27350 [Streptomyces sp. NPDC001792]|uniref:hypothetical protein n=1 Tax=Streptomyces sp. NPDC001792 TaxID=3154524 RepID=UPI003331DA03
MTRPSLAQATAGFPASDAWWNAQVYGPLNWLYGQGGDEAPWVTPALNASYTGDGNSNGTPQYRVLTIAGAKFVQWRGGLNVTYTSGSPNNGGNFLNAALPTAARPLSRRTVTAACSAASSSSLSVKIDFQTDGTVSIVVMTGVTPPWVSLNGVLYSID